MSSLGDIGLLLRITRTHGILRRYFVVNGFDGALTMLGLIIGFLLSEPAELSVVISVCLGAAVALGVSGVSSAYISESAELRRSLVKLEEAMITDLSDSAHQLAARWVPVLVAGVNGAAPLLISICILVPLWLARSGLPLPIPPLYAAVTVALGLIFFLGVFLGRISGASIWRSGLQTLVVALVTIGLITVFAGE